MIEVFGVALGSAAQVGTFGILLAALIGGYVKLRDRRMTFDENMYDNLMKQYENIQSRLAKCEQDCRDETKRLNDEIFGLRKQHVAEQIALINIIIDSVDNPALQALRSTLESIQMRLDADKNLRLRVGSVEGDAKEHS